jgi:hypothetical protein
LNWLKISPGDRPSRRFSGYSQERKSTLGSRPQQVNAWTSSVSAKAELKAIHDWLEH